MRETIRHLDEWARPRTVIVLTLLLLGALWAVVIVSSVAARDASIAATGRILQQMTAAVEEQTRQQFRLLDTFLVSCEHWLQANPKRDPGSDPAFRKLIESFRARTGESIEIQLLATDGQLLQVAGEAAGRLTHLAAAESFSGALPSAGLLIGTPRRDRSGDGQTLPVGRPLQTPMHGIRMLLAVVDLETLRRTYEAQRLQPGGTIALLRSDGTLLARAPEPVGPSRSMPGQPLPRDLALQPKAFVVLDDSGGERVGELVSYSSMSDFPLLVIVQQDYPEALSAWRRQTLWIVLLALGVTVPLALVAWRSLRLLRVLAHRDEQLVQLAATDRLTGVSSRQHFVDTLTGELDDAQRQELPLTVLLFDIDFFKRINDGYGHVVGDQALIAFARAATRCLRQRDLLGRLGGGEFAILLPETDLREALLLAERVRSAVAAIAIPTENGTVQFTVSIGASEACGADRSTDDLIKRATQALHEAEAGGHDRIVAI